MEMVEKGVTHGNATSLRKIDADLPEKVDNLRKISAV
jgi:hypothetical protein